MSAVYGCHNREPFEVDQVAHGLDSATGDVIRSAIPFRMAQECQYTKTDLGKADSRCAGCSWRGPVAE